MRTDFRISFKGLRNHDGGCSRGKKEWFFAVQLRWDSYFSPAGCPFHYPSHLNGSLKQTIKPITRFSLKWVHLKALHQHVTAKSYSDIRGVKEKGFCKTEMKSMLAGGGWSWVRERVGKKKSKWQRGWLGRGLHARPPHALTLGRAGRDTLNAYGQDLQHSHTAGTRLPQKLLTRQGQYFLFYILNPL